MKRVLPGKIKHTADGAVNWLKYDALSGGFKKALIFLLIFALTAIVVSVPTYLAYKKVQNLVEEELGKNAKNIAAATAVLIEQDMDDFKLVNDKHGHLTGDAVLKSIARILKNQTRDSDVCSRYGGDEFVILLPDAEEKQAAHIAERIREVISNIALLDEAKNNLFSTVSVGVAQWSKGMNGESLTDNADKAMYASKANGRNRVTIYDAQEEGLGTSHVKTHR